MDNRIDLILENLAQQRNAALDQLAIRTADLAIATARVAELEKELAALKPAEEGKEPEEKKEAEP